MLEGSGGRETRHYKVSVTLNLMMLSTVAIVECEYSSECNGGVGVGISVFPAINFCELRGWLRE